MLKLPITAGIRAPPKNSRMNNNEQITVKLFKNGTGIEAKEAITPQARQKSKACLLVYPPSLSISLPPTATPRTGPIVEIEAKATNTVPFS